MTRRPVRTWTIWLACAAIWLGAIAPAVSQAAGGFGPSRWVEVCTGSGMRWVAVDPTGQPSVPAGQGTGGTVPLEHCLACFGGASGLPPPAAPSVPPPFALGLVMQAVPPLAGAASTEPWPGASSRGPPASG